MRDDEGVALDGTRRLPPAAMAALHDAFAGEVAERLPRLRVAADTGDADLLAAALRDAHSLGSSSAVLGEADASLCARAAEQLLLNWQTGGELVLPALRTQVDALHAHLAGWLP